jgi:hypothetical protein
VSSDQAIERKGPFDWLEALRGVFRAGSKSQATWFAEEPLLSQMKRGAAKLGNGEMLSFPGSVIRSEIMNALRATEIFLFGRKIESPRCLREGLASSRLLGFLIDNKQEKNIFRFSI